MNEWTHAHINTSMPCHGEMDSFYMYIPHRQAHKIFRVIYIIEEEIGPYNIKSHTCVTPQGLFAVMMNIKHRRTQKERGGA